MELVLLGDVQRSYAGGWVPVANTTGIEEIHVGDRFRERGFGPGGEELEVFGISISPVGGHSRIFFNRCANATQPAVHRLGAVLDLVGIALQTEPSPLASAGEPPEIHEPVAVTTPAEPPSQIIAEIATAEDATSTTPLMTPLVRKKRGRPIGSRNKPKEAVLTPSFD